MRRELLRPPDDLELEAGGRGELMIARIRLGLVLLLAPIPILNAIELTHRENRVGGAIVVIAIAAALLIYRAARTNPRRHWIGVASTVIDVTLISLALATFLVLRAPLTATNSLVLFGIYYIAIMATALRHDPRLSILAGALAVGQYAIIVIVAAVQYDLLEPGVYSVRYGAFSWGSQVARLIMHAAAAGVATIVVVRQAELLHRSSMDWLTGLYNRGAFSERLDTEVTRSRRHRHPMSLAIIDIDLFKRINDEFGHAAGDEALVQFSDALRAEFRTTDLLVRLGGEEFVVMMPETPPDNATAKIDRFVRTVAESSFVLRRGTSLRMTVSAGVAGLPVDRGDPTQLIETADARLLEAKRTGRNRVVGPSTELAERA